MLLYQKLYDAVHICAIIIDENSLKIGNNPLLMEMLDLSGIQRRNKEKEILWPGM